MTRARAEVKPLIQSAIYWNDMHRAVAFEVGEGNLSQGVRALTEWYSKAKEEHERKQAGHELQSHQ